MLLSVCNCTAIVSQEWSKLVNTLLNRQTLQINDRDLLLSWMSVMQVIIMEEQMQNTLIPVDRHQVDVGV